MIWYLLHHSTISLKQSHLKYDSVWHTPLVWSHKWTGKRMAFLGLPGYFSSSYQGLPLCRAPHVAIIVQKDVFGPQGDSSDGMRSLPPGNFGENFIQNSIQEGIWIHVGWIIFWIILSTRSFGSRNLVEVPKNQLLSSTALNLDGKSPCRADIPNPKTPAVPAKGYTLALDIGRPSNKKKSTWDRNGSPFFFGKHYSCNHSVTFGSIIRTR